MFLCKPSVDRSSMVYILVLVLRTPSLLVNSLYGVANGTSKNVGLGKFWQDLEISEAFLISLEVSFFHGLFLLFLSIETFHQRVSGSDFYLGSRRLGESRILPFATPPLPKS